MINEAIKGFKEIFNDNKDYELYFSPGRVNLIGEHTDYNGGYVFPFAISLGTYGVFQKRNDNLVCLYSKGFSKEIDTFKINDFIKDKNHSWIDYIKGVIKGFNSFGYNLDKGFNLYITNDIPLQSGLSSSASIEMLICVIINDYYNLNLDMIELVKIAQYAENKYVLVNSGIMDQFAIGMSKKNEVILLNTKTLEYEYVPLTLKDVQIILVNTNKKRELSSGMYNKRVSECQSALAKLKSKIDTNYLCDVKIEDLKKYQSILTDVEYKRSMHLVTETKRTLDAKDFLNLLDTANLGIMLTESHLSLDKLYEVTGDELNTIVYQALLSNALGARMTGAGFGGCAIILANMKDVQKIKSDINKTYYDKFGYKPSFYEVNSVDGTKKITNEVI